MRRTRVNDALQSQAPTSDLLVKGWVRTRRDAKGFSFIEVNDGSCLQNLQVIVDDDSEASASVKQINTGSAVEVKGELVASPGKGQKWELQASRVALLGGPIRRLTPVAEKASHG